MSKGHLTIVWGGQFGSEGKGQIAQHIHQINPVDISVRVGGPNAGHTFYHNGQKVVVQSIPTPAMTGGTGVIGPAGLIIPELLENELKRSLELMGHPARLIIDENAAVITQAHMDAEIALKGRIGSTGEGVGAATADKVWRRPDLVVGSRLTSLFPDPYAPWLNMVTSRPDTAWIVNDLLLKGAHVLIEGTQGYGLSLHTGGYYPFCTSRECTPQALLAETGVNPKNADIVESIMVVRTFPIRVGGTSGPLPGEITWEELSKMTGGYVTTPEITTVTKKNRRIAEMDMGLLLRAVRQCGPDSIALTFLDYKFPKMANQSSDGTVGPAEYMDTLREHLGVPVNYYSTGPGYTFGDGVAW